MTDRKQDFIDDYVEAASTSLDGSCSRTVDELHSDAEADWEAKLIDAAYERYRDEGGTP